VRLVRASIARKTVCCFALAVLCTLVLGLLVGCKGKKMDSPSKKGAIIAVELDAKNKLKDKEIAPSSQKAQRNSDSQKPSKAFSIEKVSFSPKDLKRDPFVSYFSQIADVGEMDEQILGRLDLAELTLRGTIVLEKKRYALIEDPTGQGHIVSLGSYIGRGLNHVKYIRSGEVIIESYLEGQKKSRFVTLSISK